MDNSVPLFISYIYTVTPSPFPTDIECVLYPILKWMGGGGNGVREGHGQDNGKLNSLIEVSS